MSLKTDFEKQVLKDVSYTLPDPKQHNICVHARAFAAWCEQLVDSVQTQRTDARIKAAFQELQHRFFRLYSDAPDACRDHFLPEEGLVCLFACYKATYEALGEQAVTALTTRETAAKPQEITTLPFGEIEGVIDETI